MYVCLKEGKVYTKIRVFQKFHIKSQDLDVSKILFFIALFIAYSKE